MTYSDKRGRIVEDKFQNELHRHNLMGIFHSKTINGRKFLFRNSNTTIELKMLNEVPPSLKRKGTGQ